MAAVDQGTCKHCGATFRFTPLKPGTPPPKTCGTIDCRSREDWTADEWEGKARMAAARSAAGLELGALDVEALRRFPTPRSCFA